jgi:TIR domain
MAEAQERSAERPKVFISYSRADASTLAEELVLSLPVAGFEPYLDKHDIEKAVDWEERLGGLILKADTVSSLSRRHRCVRHAANGRSTAQ